MKKGVLITFEGGEGAGKSTQIQAVAKWLSQKGYPVLVTREPGGTVLANWIRNILLDPKNSGIHPGLELLLYEGARQDHVEKVIQPVLDQGKIVLCDRFTDATIAYQGYGRLLSIPLIRSLNQTVTAGVKPKLTFLFDLPVSTGLKRTRGRTRRPDRLDREKRSFHQRVRKGYLTLATKERRFCVIDTRKPRDEVLRMIVSEIKKVL